MTAPAVAYVLSQAQFNFSKLVADVHLASFLVVEDMFAEMNPASEISGGMLFIPSLVI